jgi:hypothetical protein
MTLVVEAGRNTSSRNSYGVERKFLLTPRLREAVERPILERALQQVEAAGGLLFFTGLPLAGPIQ